MKTVCEDNVSLKRVIKFKIGIFMILSAHKNAQLFCFSSVSCQHQSMLIDVYHVCFNQEARPLFASDCFIVEVAY